VHVTRADWPQLRSAISFARREDNERISSVRISTDGYKAWLEFRILGIRHDECFDVIEHVFDLRDRNAVLLALFSIAIVPIKARWPGRHFLM
jgi:uncharacterized protein (DUF1810 family)